MKNKRKGTIRRAPVGAVIPVRTGFFGKEELVLIQELSGRALKDAIKDIKGRAKYIQENEPVGKGVKWRDLVSAPATLMQLEDERRWRKHRKKRECYVVMLNPDSDVRPTIFHGYDARQVLQAAEDACKDYDHYTQHIKIAFLASDITEVPLNHNIDED